MLLQILTTYLVLVNACAFALMLADKLKAKTGAWRIPEAALLTTAVLGGSVGAIMGMYLFRHKTRHSAFRWGIPLFLIAHAVILWLLNH